jgi:alpha-L-fucosidase
MTKAGYFMEDQEVKYTAQDVRFTAKEDVLYAICLGWPDEQFTVQALKNLYSQEIKSVHLLGDSAPLAWSLDGDGLKIQRPAQQPCEHAFVFKIERNHPFSAQSDT